MTSQTLLQQYGPRESMDYDVVIVGAGPAGLSAAIQLKQAAQARGSDISVCVLEKGSEPGAHILAGTVIDPEALSELFPDWKNRGAPLHQPVIEDQMLFLSAGLTFRSPGFLTPYCLRNEGNYIISLGNLVRWLASQAEELGVEIFPGFAATEILWNENGAVTGVATGNMGIDRDGKPTGHFQLGMELRAKYTLFGEGSRGQLGRQLLEKLQLDAKADPQTYSLGVKELWEIDPAKHRPGLVIHTAGWPFDSKTYGGGFLYHMEGRRVALGLITGLGYSNPWLSPFEEMQRWKTHPAIRTYLEGGKRIGYGARAITAGGLLSLPKFVFPGGALIGCDAGFLNASRIKGSHSAIKTGMLAALAIDEALAAGREHDELEAYSDSFRDSWLYEELNRARNFKQWFKKGLFMGTLMTGIEQFALPLIGIKNPPWTLHNDKPDHLSLHLAAKMPRINYPKPDGIISFDRLSSVFLSNTNHEENQPPHLNLKNAHVPLDVNFKLYALPEARYCPAGVYEYVEEDGKPPRLQINAQNCIHCKTCDIKDPTQNIVWVAPEGGGGPNYVDM